MKLEFVQKQLQEWGEIMITTATGAQFELHLGDTTFDMDNRLIYLKGEHSDYVINGDGVDVIEKHYGHAVKG